MVKKPDGWAWSSYRASLGLEPAPLWLAEDGLLAMFAKRRSVAQQRYAQFVAEGIKADSPWGKLKGQVFLGDEQFVARMQVHIQNGKDDVQIPLAQRRPKPPSLAEIAKRAPDRNAAIVAAYATGGYSYQQIADFFGVHFTTAGRIVRGGM
jgi:hypothetical protein